MARFIHNKTGRLTKSGCWPKHQKMVGKKKVLGMGWPGGQNVRTPQESVFMLSRGLPGPYMKNIEK